MFAFGPMLVREITPAGWILTVSLGFFILMILGRKWDCKELEIHHVQLTVLAVALAVFTYWSLPLYGALRCWGITLAQSRMTYEIHVREITPVGWILPTVVGFVILLALWRKQRHKSFATRYAMLMVAIAAAAAFLTYAALPYFGVSVDREVWIVSHAFNEMVST